MRLLTRSLSLLALTSGLLAQDSAPTSRPGSSPSSNPVLGTGPIAESRLREIVEFLADDKMLGRDTGSQELERAAAYLVEGFRKAGLEPVAAGEWTHSFEVPAVRCDSGALRIEFRGAAEPLALRPLTDVRLWTPGMELNGTLEFTHCASLAAYGQALRARELGGRGRRPVLIEVPDDSPFWQAAVERRVLVNRAARQSSAPVLLVRQGLVPAGVTAAEFVVPAGQPAPHKLQNVVGMLRGKAKPEEYVLISAHYDHIGIRFGGGTDYICNGADDNASGTAAVLALAEAFAASDVRPDRSLLFVCFAAEEQGLLGSAAFAGNPPVGLDRIVCNLNLEMLGRPEQGKQSCVWLTGESLSDLRSWLEPAFERAGVRVIQHPSAEGLFMASDNFSLARKGVLAQSVSAGSLHVDYHRPTDSVDKLDLPHMAQVVHGIYQAVCELANVNTAPAYNDKGRQVLNLPGK